MASIALPWIQLLAAFGALQGILLACVLVAHRKNRTAHRLLAALMVSFSLYLGSSAIEFAGLVRALPDFLGVGYQPPLVLGPLVDLYLAAASARSWPLWLAGAGAAIWLLATVLRIADVGVRDEHVTLAIALLVYSIGYAALKQPEVFRYETAEYPVPVRLVAAEPPASPPRYERPALADGEAAQLERRLIEVMESERPWADSELTLSDLAARLDSTPHKLSELLNAQIGKSFYDFVNGYRVREVQRRIQAGEARTRKMLALALDAGFASKSTFNEAFKKHTLQTPSDFRQAVGA